jgi:hypothetical protein
MLLVLAVRRLTQLLRQQLLMATSFLQLPCSILCSTEPCSAVRMPDPTKRACIFHCLSHPLPKVHIALSNCTAVLLLASIPAETQGQHVHGPIGGKHSSNICSELLRMHVSPRAVLCRLACPEKALHGGHSILSRVE